MESWDNHNPTYIHYEYEDLTQKRARVSRACNRCRYRKTRCDGRRPFCVPCERRGFSENCTYPPSRNRWRNKSQSRSPSHQSAPVSNEDGHGQGQQSRSRTSTEEMADRDANAKDEEHEDPSALQPWSSTHGDGLGTFAGRDDGSVYGPSSTVSFFQQVLVDDIPKSPSAGPSQPRAAQSSRNIAKESTAVLVPRRHLKLNVNHYMDCFWEFVHPVFPVLHKISFIQEYESHQTAQSGSPDAEGEHAETPVNPVFLSTMNLVFALGCKFSQQVPDGQKVAIAEGFYKTSQTASSYDLMDSTSLDVVQMLVLSGVYLQSTQLASRCWNVVGLAIRIAQSLGLHAERHGSPTRSQVEREMRRRIWHTCVNLDR